MEFFKRLWKITKENKKDEHKNFVVIDPKLIKNLLKLPKPIGMKIIERVNYKMNLQKDNVLKQAFEEKLPPD